MKKRAAIFFLVILSIPTVYKIGFYTFFELNRDFIAENYCINRDRPITMCYGQCFLDRAIQLADQTRNPESLISQLKFEVLDFLVNDVTVPDFKSGDRLTISFPQVPFLSDGVFSPVFRPPLA